MAEQKSNEAIRTLTVAFILCVVCSIIVSATAVSLKKQQQVNAVIDVKKNILNAAGLIKEGEDVEEVFEKITTLIVDLETGEIKTDIDKASYDQVKASQNPEMSLAIPAEKDIGALSRRAKYGKLYAWKNESGELEGIIFQITSKGLWSTMRGFVALDATASEVKGFAYYSHGETPGLGGEVDNPKWKQQWIGKNVFNDQGEVAFGLAKGSVDQNSKLAQYQVDGLSGATITGNGVSASLKYWFGDHGYGKFIENLKAGRIRI